MSYVACHIRDLPNKARCIPLGKTGSAPSPAVGQALPMQGLRMIGALLAIGAVVTAAAAVKLAIWLPLYWH